ncbi:uncharacterized protein LOC119369819 [Jatropha curcas]|uniref:uncharacterized protein LOC119369819 n=1 Tax=Jatropha curcas TaxID=180498 RepID=UPI0018955F4D|nr:uncharacterized protein LOC119369819 [Jatropha curcas]
MVSTHCMEWHSFDNLNVAIGQRLFHGNGPSVRPCVNLNNNVSWHAFCDASLFQSEDVTCAAVVFEDSEGRFLQVVSTHSAGCKQPATAEALALHSALLFIGNHYQSSGYIFIDCQVLFCALNSKTLDLSEFGVIVKDYKQLVVDRPDI